MYVYYIRDDATEMYLFGCMKLGAPVPTCVWGYAMADAMRLDSPTEARRKALETGCNTASPYRLNLVDSTETRLKTGGDSR